MRKIALFSTVIVLSACASAPSPTQTGMPAPAPTVVTTTVIMAEESCYQPLLSVLVQLKESFDHLLVRFPNEVKIEFLKHSSFCSHYRTWEESPPHLATVRLVLTWKRPLSQDDYDKVSSFLLEFAVSREGI